MEPEMEPEMEPRMDIRRRLPEVADKIQAACDAVSFGWAKIEVEEIIGMITIDCPLGSFVIYPPLPDYEPKRDEDRKWFLNSYTYIPPTYWDPGDGEEYEISLADTLDELIVSFFTELGRRSTRRVNEVGAEAEAEADWIPF